MKVHYKIALAAAVAFFIVVSAYMLTSGNGDDTTVVDAPATTTTLPMTTAANNSDNINPVPLNSGNSASNGGNQDLKSLVRDHLAAFNKPANVIRLHCKAPRGLLPTPP